MPEPEETRDRHPWLTRGRLVRRKKYLHRQMTRLQERERQLDAKGRTLLERQRRDG